MRKKEKYKFGDYKLIQYQILQTNITRTVYQTVRRITNQILGVKGLKTNKNPSLEEVVIHRIITNWFLCFLACKNVCNLAMSTLVENTFLDNFCFCTWQLNLGHSLVG